MYNNKTKLMVALTQEVEQDIENLKAQSINGDMTTTELIQNKAKVKQMLKLIRRLSSELSNECDFCFDREDFKL